jgi:hypothetical protein
MGLVIGLGALEARQERVVDVDAAAEQLGRQTVRQDLHVAREHDEIGLGLLDQLPELGFLLHLGLLGHRQVMEGQVADIGRGEARPAVVRDDRR